MEKRRRRELEESRTEINESSIEFGWVGRVLEYVVTCSTGEELGRRTTVEQVFEG